MMRSFHKYLFENKKPLFLLPKNNGTLRQKHALYQMNYSLFQDVIQNQNLLDLNKVKENLHMNYYHVEHLKLLLLICLKHLLMAI